MCESGHGQAGLRGAGKSGLLGNKNNPAAMGKPVTYKNAAAIILGRSQVPMHYADITDRAIEEGLIAPSGKTPHDTMGAQLATDIKKGARSRFVRTSPSHYALNPDYEHPTTPPKPEPGPVEPKGQVAARAPSSYTGKAGEHLVASRLLFLGYNVSIMAVDTGADLIATKDKSTFYIQVKTANPNKNRYRFNIRTSSFEKNAGSSVFYIFVIRQGDASAAKQCEDFLILPYTKIQEYIDKKLIRHILDGTVLDVTILRKEDGFFLSGREGDIKHYMNKWSSIS